MDIKNISLIGVASLILSKLRQPKTLPELIESCQNIISQAREGRMLFERALAMLIDLSQIKKLSDGRIFASRTKVNKQAIFHAARI